MPELRRTALVTGGTSGIGLAVTELLAAQGHAVFLCARDADCVDLVVEKLRGRGLEVSGARADVRDAGDVTALVRAAVDRYGPLRVLVNNAARSGCSPADGQDEPCDRLIAGHLSSVFRVTREVLAGGGMRAAGRGRIISVVPTDARPGAGPLAPYSAARHGVIGFTKALGLELAGTGITVNAVCPGYLALPTPAPAAHRTTALLHRTPLGRHSTPQEAAALVAHLTTDHAATITAQALDVCAGLGAY